MKGRILVVEDSHVVALDIAIRLKRLGYGVAGIAAYGEEAVNLASYQRPDLVLMDIILKGDMDGVEAATIIKDQYRIPVVYLTAHNDVVSMERAAQTEPYGYLLKPFNETLLHTTIEVALFRHQAEHASSEDRSREKWALFQIARIIAEPAGAIGRTKALLEALKAIANADSAELRVPGPGGLVWTAVDGATDGEEPPMVSLTDSVAGVAFRQRSPVAVNDYPAHRLADPTTVARGVKSLLSLPIGGNGSAIAVIDLASRALGHFTPRMVRVLGAIGEGIGMM